MIEVKNQTKKQIYLVVDNKYLKGVNKGTPGFSNQTNLEVI